METPWQLFMLGKRLTQEQLDRLINQAKLYDKMNQELMRAKTNRGS